MKGKYNDILFTAIVHFKPALNWLATSPVSGDFGLPQPASRFALATARWTRGEKKKKKTTRSRARPAAERRSFGLLFTWVVPPLEAPATEWRNYNGWGNTSCAPLLPLIPPLRHECGTGRWLLMARSAARVILMSGFIRSCYHSDHGSVCVFLKPFFSPLNGYFPSCHTSEPPSLPSLPPHSFYTFIPLFCHPSTLPLSCKVIVLFTHDGHVMNRVAHVSNWGCGEKVSFEFVDFHLAVSFFHPIFLLCVFVGFNRLFSGASGS